MNTTFEQWLKEEYGDDDIFFLAPDMFVERHVIHHYAGDPESWSEDQYTLWIRGKKILLKAPKRRLEEEIGEKAYGENYQSWRPIMAYEWPQEPEALHVFPSFSFLIPMIASSAIPEQALRTGLFTFNARRRLVVDMLGADSQLELMLGDQEIQRRAWKNILIPAVLQAEQEGRILWRTNDGTPYEEYREFFAHHDVHLPEKLNGYPGLQAIREALEKLNRRVLVWIA